MKRYDLELTATGPVMEEREQGTFVPFSEVSGLAEQLADATRQCGVMAEFLREAVRVIPAIGVAIDDLPVVDVFLERIEAVLAGKLPDHPEQPLDMVSLPDIASLQRYTLGGHCDSFGQDCGAEMEQDDEGEYIFLAEVLNLAGNNPQGGEQIVKCPHCNAEFQDGSDAAEFIGWHGLCSLCEIKSWDTQ